ncbi:MAG: hypothetical protein ABH856_00215 [Patescibacteria group bacterium]|nr:hypothetical protein [Patescibacteria group bacterium]
MLEKTPVNIGLVHCLFQEGHDDELKDWLIAHMTELVRERVNLTVRVVAPSEHGDQTECVLREVRAMLRDWAGTYHYILASDPAIDILGGRGINVGEGSRFRPLGGPGFVNRLRTWLIYILRDLGGVEDEHEFEPESLKSAWKEIGVLRRRV